MTIFARMSDHKVNNKEDFDKERTFTEKKHILEVFIIIEKQLGLRCAKLSTAKTCYHLAWSLSSNSWEVAPH